MSEAFLKALKWYVLVFSVIVGASAFIISDQTGSVKPIMLGVLGFGVAYIMSYFWTEFREKLLFLSILTFVGLSFLAPYAPDALYVLFGYKMIVYNPYYMWAATVAVLGIPIMWVVFYFYD